MGEISWFEVGRECSYNAEHTQLTNGKLSKSGKVFGPPRAPLYCDLDPRALRQMSQLIVTTPPPPLSLLSRHSDAVLVCICLSVVNKLMRELVKSMESLFPRVSNLFFQTFDLEKGRDNIQSKHASI